MQEVTYNRKGYIFEALVDDLCEETMVSIYSKSKMKLVSCRKLDYIPKEIKKMLFLGFGYESETRELRDYYTTEF